MSPGTRRAWIILLLEHYLDVVQGMRDRRGGDEGLALMCEAWNRPLEGYPTLERLLQRMSREAPSLFLVLRHAYLDPMAYYERRVLACQHPHCGYERPIWSGALFHTHGRKHVRLVPRLRRVYRRPPDSQGVELAVRWLEQEWGPDILLPSILAPFLDGHPVVVLSSQP